MRLVLHIDRLVMQGLPISRSQLPIVREALEAELVRVFSSSGASQLAAAGSVQKMVAKPFDLRPEAGTARIGRQVARAVHAATKGDASG